MLVAPTQSNSPPALAGLLTGASAGDNANQANAASLRTATTPEAKAQPDPASIAPGDTVQLSPARDRPVDSAPAPIYAEVWKDGVKVAAIDSHGGVVSFAGPVAPPAAGAAGGPWIAAVRAAQVAQTVGGEIRINGLTVDAGTLRTRVQLENAYGR